MAKYKWDELFGWNLTESAWKISSQKRFFLFIFGFILILPLSAILGKLLPDFLVSRVLMELYIYVVAFYLGKEYLKSFEIDWKSYYQFLTNKNTLLSFLLGSLSLVVIRFILNKLLAGFPSGFFKFLIISPVISLISLFFTCWIILSLLLVMDDEGHNLSANLQKAGEVISRNLLGFFILIIIKLTMVLLGFMSVGVGFYFLLPVLFLIPALLIEKIKKDPSQILESDTGVKNE